MRGLGNPDSKIFSLLNKAARLMELNLLVVMCCLPVVTAGAAFSSMHAVLLKIYRNEEKQVAADYFQAMKSNLKNSTMLWILFLQFAGLLIGMGALTVSKLPDHSVYVLFCLLLVAVMGMLYLNWALILQSRYVYTIPQCLKNALLAWIQYPGSTFVFLVSILVPTVLCTMIQLWPLVAMIGITLPALISTTLYSRVFDRMEGVPDRVHEL